MSLSDVNSAIEKFEENLTGKSEEEFPEGLLKVKGFSMKNVPSLSHICEGVKDLPSDGQPSIKARSRALNLKEAGIMDLSPDFLENLSEKFEELKEAKEKVREVRAEGYERAKERCRNSLGYSLRSVIPGIDAEQYLHSQVTEMSEKEYQALWDSYKDTEESIKEFPGVALYNKRIDVRGDFWPALYSSYSLEEGGIMTKLTALAINPESGDLDNPVVRKGFSAENIESTRLSYDGWSIGSLKLDGKEEDLYELNIKDIEIDHKPLNEFIERVYFSS